MLPWFLAVGGAEWDEWALVAPNDAFVPVEAVHHGAAVLVAEESDEHAQALESRFQISASHEGVDYTVSLVIGASPVALAVLTSGEYDKYHPPFVTDETFVWLTRSEAVTTEWLEDVVAAFLFELATTTGLVFRRYKRTGPWYGPEESEGDEEWTERFRPLVFGPGTRELLNLFNSAAAASEADHRIAGYTKVIEFVAATVVRVASFDALRVKLASRSALQPDARFLSELKRLVESQKDWVEDKRSIELAIQTCCDAGELQREAPPFCKGLHGLPDSSTDKQRREALADFAGRLTATRNALAHAKPNYRPRGVECAPEDYGELAQLAARAAEFAVRWYATSDPAMRFLPDDWGRPDS